jgi:hypothetical protein
MTDKETKLKAKAWDELVRQNMLSSITYTPQKLAQIMVDISCSLQPEYFYWGWALDRLIEGKRITWKDWGYSWIQAYNTFIHRYSMFNGKVTDMGVYGISEFEKFTKRGWTLYKEDE